MSQSDGQNKPELDPKVVEEVENALSEEEIIGMYGGDGSREERMPLVENWFPESDEWQGKTAIQPHQAHALAAAKNLAQAFPEIEHLDGFIHNLVNDYEMLLTSVEGLSREQQMNVLRAMFGAGSAEEAEARTSLMTQLLTGKQDNDE